MYCAPVVGINGSALKFEGRRLPVSYLSHDLATTVMSLVKLLHLAQVGLSSYGLYLSYITVTNLQQYEEQSKKVAEYSEIAAQQLHKTRTTQTSGALTFLASLITSLVLATVPSTLPWIVRLSASPLLLVGTFFAAAHVGDFWENKGKVPFVEGYNEAISRTKDMIVTMEYLKYSWLVTALCGAIFGY